jgi:hypothetical protein
MISTRAMITPTMSTSTKVNPPEPRLGFFMPN